MSALAAGVAPATGDSPIKATASVSLRTITVTFTDTPFDAADDVTFLFYIPESETSDNIIEENITILRLKSNMSSSCDVAAKENNNNDDIVYC